MLVPLSRLLHMATFASDMCPCPRYFYGAYNVSNITPASFIELISGTACRLFLCYHQSGLEFLVDLGAIHFSLLQDVGQAIYLRTRRFLYMCCLSQSSCSPRVPIILLILFPLQVCVWAFARARWSITLKFVCWLVSTSDELVLLKFSQSKGSQWSRARSRTPQVVMEHTGCSCFMCTC